MKKNEKKKRATITKNKKARDTEKTKKIERLLVVYERFLRQLLPQ